MDRPIWSPRNQATKAHIQSACSSLDTQGKASLTNLHFDVGQFLTLVSHLKETPGNANLGPPRLIFSNCSFFDLSVSALHTYGELICDDCQFQGSTRFSSVTFGGNVYFRHSSFFGPFSFAGVTCEQECSFQNAWFDDFTFVGTADDSEARSTVFSNECCFSNATFDRDVQFRNVLASGRMTFSGAKFRDTLSITELTMAAVPSAAVTNGPLVRPVCSFHLTEFDGPAEIQAHASGPRCVHDISFSRAIANRGLFFVGDNVSLDLSQMLLPMGGSFAALSNLGDLGEVIVEDVSQTSLDGVSFDSLDLTHCPLSTAASLSSLRLEGSTKFPVVSSGPWRRTAIADEASGMVTDRRRLEVTYRSLRAAVESSGDFPGAADFYYGEMGNRRLRAETRPLERVLLSIYELISGYGTRPLRAFVSLVGFVIVAGLLLDTTGALNSGLEGGDNGWLFVLKSATSFGVPQPNEQSNLVDTLYVMTKIVGVTLFGLWVLALRSRVRR